MHVHFSPRRTRIRQFAGLLSAVASTVALLTVFSASTLAAETKTFTGQKNCGTPVVSVSPPASGGYCLITMSSFKILLGAKVYYTDAHVVAGVLRSPVTLNAIDERGSTATGQCTYFTPKAYPPGHGLCTYSGGTGKLAGFHATVLVGPPIGGQRLYELSGTYWFDHDHEGESN